MDRRTLLALVLVALVILLTPRLFAPPPPVVTSADSSVVVDSVRQPIDTAQRAVSPTPPAVVAQPETTLLRVPAETLHVGDSTSAFTFVNQGGALQQVEMRQFRALGGREGMVKLEGDGAPSWRSAASSVATPSTLRRQRSAPFDATSPAQPVKSRTKVSSAAIRWCSTTSSSRTASWCAWMRRCAARWRRMDSFS